MATGAQYTSVKHTVIHPNFLHTNSTSHRWAFSAIAELIDNACDDAQATQFCIDMQQFDVTAEDGTTRDMDTLVFMDNGLGMDPHQLHKMLGFGHSDKASNARAIGRFGNGFKAGSMRLGKDALVLTKCARSQSAGFLSQSFLKARGRPAPPHSCATGCDDILVPMVSWDLEGKRLNNNQANTEQSLHAINRFSIFQDEDSLLAQLSAMPDTGTIIIISGLRRDETGALELDFDTDTNDIRIARDIAYGDEENGTAVENFQQMRSGQARSTDVKLDYSLRQYVSVLYKVPHMQIFVRDQKVRTQRVTSLLRSKLHERFTPRNTAPGVYADIEMGFNTEDPSLYGMMIYHRNRLIRPYHRVGMQLEANEKGVGVLGVVQADYLEPTHNKQDFNDTAAYRALQNKLADILKIYWWDKVEKDAVPQPLALPGTAPPVRISHLSQQPGQQNGASAAPAAAAAPDDLWVQCDEPSCLKWRKMPPGWTLQQVEAAQEDGSWYCRLNPDAAAAAAACARPEETYAAPQSAAADTRIVKKRYNEAKEQEKTARKKKRESEETERRRIEVERHRQLANIIRQDQEAARQVVQQQLAAQLQQQQQLAAHAQQQQQKMWEEQTRLTVYQKQQEKLRQEGILQNKNVADLQQVQPISGGGVGSAAPAIASPTSVALTLPLSFAELATIRTGLAPALLAPALQKSAAAAALPPGSATAPKVPASAAARPAAGLTAAPLPAAAAAQPPAAPASTAAVTAAAAGTPAATAAAAVAARTAATPVTTAVTSAAAPTMTAAAAAPASAPAAAAARPAAPAAAALGASTPQRPTTRASGGSGDTNGVTVAGRTPSTAASPGPGSTRGTPAGPATKRVAHVDLVPLKGASVEPKLQRAAHADYQKRPQINAHTDAIKTSSQPADEPAGDREAADAEAPAASASAGPAVTEVEDQLESTPSAQPIAAATPAHGSKPNDKEASAGPNSASTEQAVSVPAAVARSTQPAATARPNGAADLPVPAAASESAGPAGDKALAEGLARQRAEAAELVNKLQAKVAGLEESLQGTRATLNALSVNMRKVLTALLTQSMGANADVARHFEQLGPDQLAKFDVDVFCRNLAPARKT